MVLIMDQRNTTTTAITTGIIRNYPKLRGLAAVAVAMAVGLGVGAHPTIIQQQPQEQHLRKNEDVAGKAVLPTREGGKADY